MKPSVSSVQVWVFRHHDHPRHPHLHRRHGMKTVSITIGIHTIPVCSCASTQAVDNPFSAFGFALFLFLVLVAVASIAVNNASRHELQLQFLWLSHRCVGHDTSAFLQR